MTLPKPTRRKPSSLETKALVTKFYQCDENSRIVPGMKDFLSVKKCVGSREHIEKRLWLCNLNELYAEFAPEHQEI